jgi:phosphonate transport system ATP-binding protein
MMHQDIVFELQSVSYNFGAFQALSDLSFRIQTGERVAIVGSSGAGKSTLLQLLNTTLLPTQGEIFLWGQNSRQIKPKVRQRLQRKIGMIYQQLHLVDTLGVIHNVNAGHLGRWSLLKALLSLILPQEVEIAHQALVKVGIPEKIFDRTDTLSGGQQQRVAIARILVQDPAVILADEPIASLDPSLSRDVMELLCQLCIEQGRTLIVSLHDIQMARTYCDRMIGLQQGKMIFDIPSDRLTETMISQLYDSLR